MVAPYTVSPLSQIFEWAMERLPSPHNCVSHHAADVYGVRHIHTYRRIFNKSPDTLLSRPPAFFSLYCYHIQGFTNLFNGRNKQSDKVNKTYSGVTSSTNSKTSHSGIFPNSSTEYPIPLTRTAYKTFPEIVCIFPSPKYFNTVG